MPTEQIDQILGQLFLLGFQGAAVTPRHPVIEDITQENLGGVILFDRHLATASNDNNILNTGQLKTLTTTLQHAVRTEYPLLIAVDQEGGTVSRFRRQRGFAETPSAAELGGGHNTEKTRKAAAQTASLLKELGINLNLSPVADLNVWPENPIIGAVGRSFGQDVATVTKHCHTWIREHRAQNILTCLKHFPGHGSSRMDSHHHFVDISETWKREELQPYQNLIAIQAADSIMVGHLFHRQLDDRWPATLSPKVIRLLRERLRFQGPVITDDMQMEAITRRYGLAEACCRSLAAGVDLLVIGNNIEYDAGVFRKIKKKLLEEIARGTLEEARVIEAWQRVCTFRSRVRPA